jgi:integrase
MPTVFRRRKADGTLAEVYSANIWINGAMFLRSTGCKVRRDAERRAVELEAEIRADIARRHEPLTLDTMMGKYWVEHAAELPSASSVKYHIARLLKMMDKNLQLAELSNKHVNAYVVARAKMAVTKATINRELDVLCSAYMMARDRWEHPVRPIRWKDHRFPPPDARDATLSIDEARQAVLLLATRSPDAADAVELTIYTGMPLNELETLTCGRVDLAERRLIVLAKRKTRQEYRERPVALSTPAVALLSDRIRPDTDALVFDLRNLRKHWEWVRAQIGRTDVRWHDLRHTHGTLLGKVGNKDGVTADVRIIKHQLGHTHVSTSMRYVHPDHAAAVEAVEVIPALRDRKVVALGAGAQNPAEPLSNSTINKGASEESS